jgi:hypothetical protein
VALFSYGIIIFFLCLPSTPYTAPFQVISMLALLPLVFVSKAVAADVTAVGWVWGSDARRTTFDILWSCLTIFIVCTYKVVHLNLPSEEESSARWWQWPFWRMSVRKLKWMAIMALSPEIVLSVSIQDWLWARQSIQKFRSIDIQKLGALQDNYSKDSADLENTIVLCEKPGQPRRLDLLLFRYVTTIFTRYFMSHS